MSLDKWSVWQIPRNTLWLMNSPKWQFMWKEEGDENEENTTTKSLRTEIMSHGFHPYSTSQYALN